MFGVFGADPSILLENVGFEKSLLVFSVILCSLVCAILVDAYL